MLFNMFILLLASCSIFFALRYILALKENIFSLRDNLSTLENQKQKLLQDLEKEKNNLKQPDSRNAELRAYLKSAHNRLNESFRALNKVEEKIDKLGAQFSILKAENGALLEDREKLTKEIETIKMKLNSADELKKTLRGLKKEGQIESNRGFLTKSGQPTSSAKLQIEVMPASR